MECVLRQGSQTGEVDSEGFLPSCPPPLPHPATPKTYPLREQQFWDYIGVGMWLGIYGSIRIRSEGGQTGIWS
jgi:hypothetical protein